jgi:PAS domain S-box-containing protein
MSGREPLYVRLSWGAAIALSILVALLSTVFALEQGISEVYPFLYFLPIILFIYRYPERGVIFTLSISMVYLILVYFFGQFNPMLVAISTAWFVIFVSIGVVTSSFAEGMRSEERKYRGIFENSQAGILTINHSSNRILDLNRKCARMLQCKEEDLIGSDLDRVLPPSKEREAFLHEVAVNTHSGDHELRLLTCDNAVRQFLVSGSLTPSNVIICSLVDITDRKLAERVIQNAKNELEARVSERTDELLRANEILKAEIQERKRFEAAIQLANRKLHTLSSITRHDILNQVTAIVMYISMTEEMNADPQVGQNLQKINEITSLILRQIRFTRDYQNIGTSAPSWQEIDRVVDDAQKDLGPVTLTVEKALDGLEVYADLLLGKVFLNLIDNTVRHGKHATLIRVTYRREEDDTLTLIFEDNGAGIPEGVKEKIFRREFYRNTGYGLYLSKEILSSTGLSIRETGVPGSGARFEIRVPNGMFRFPGGM